MWATWHRPLRAPPCSPCCAGSQTAVPPQPQRQRASAWEQPTWRGVSCAEVSSLSSQLACGTGSGSAAAAARAGGAPPRNPAACCMHAGSAPGQPRSSAAGAAVIGAAAAAPPCSAAACNERREGGRDRLVAGSGGGGGGTPKACTLLASDPHLGVLTVHSGQSGRPAVHLSAHQQAAKPE